MAEGVAVASSTGTAFVTRSEENIVDAFDPVRMTKIASVKVADDADAIIYDRAADLLYVASGDGNMGTLIDPHTRAVVAAIPLGGKPEYPVCDSKADLIFETLTDRDQIVAIDVAQRAIVGRWPVPGCMAPTGMAIDIAHRVLFAACGRNARVAVFDMDSDKVLATIPIGPNPDVVAFDPALHRMYATGEGGKFDVIEQVSRLSYARSIRSKRIMARIRWRSTRTRTRFTSATRAFWWHRGLRCSRQDHEGLYGAAQTGASSKAREPPKLAKWDCSRLHQRLLSRRCPANVIAHLDDIVSSELSSRVVTTIFCFPTGWRVRCSPR